MHTGTPLAHALSVCQHLTVRAISDNFRLFGECLRKALRYR